MSRGGAARTVAVEPFRGNIRLSVAHGSEVDGALLQLRRDAWSAQPAVPPELEPSFETSFASKACAQVSKPSVLLVR